MTLSDEKNKTVLHVRTARVTKERAELLASVNNIPIGTLLDSIIEEAYNLALAQGKIRDYLKALQSIDSDVVS